MISAPLSLAGWEHHPDDADWIRRQLDVLPAGLDSSIRYQYGHLYTRDGRTSATLYLLAPTEEDRGHRLPLTANGADINHLAKTLATTGHRYGAQLHSGDLPAAIATAELYGLTVPSGDAE